ncbi:Molecular chaperone DnaK (HSP70) [Streptosporangium subroseum]|uniref:Molecular chaperone DnaK (HSP70) n=1 Tax=Streptosporangium subroseum TaxID=106412 RepID=A0A239MLG6_9ACTN|nr:Hsp70 family protein [Streptosporangium subroseum]SNT42639.1 Molecular chaperone DnaK (HSP70) [Streptosporangium subroseum]
MATGIDFGTTNSVVAQWTGDDVEVLSLDSDHLDSDWLYPSFENLFPTIVGESSLRLGTLFGWEAKLRSNRVIEACKRMLKDDGGIQLRDRRISATAVAAGVFQAMRDRAENNLLTSIDSAVITVPANARGGARYRTRAAARAAGIQVKALLNEPTAAAISYMHDMEEDGRIMVFDWGGGTIDVTVLEHVDGVFEELASRGITQLGGIEVDKRLRNLIFRKVGRSMSLSVGEERELDLAVERTKIRLSVEEAVLTKIPGSSKLIEVTRDELENEIADLVEQALQPARMCLNDLGMDPDAIDGVLMIGGTSQMPCVRHAVERFMNDETVPADICHPMTAVARGAAIAAAIFDNELDSSLVVSSMYALGTGITDPKTNKKTFSTIIKQHSPLPISEEKKYAPIDDNRTSLSVSVWEADPEKPLEDKENFQLTTLQLKYPRPLPAKDATFTLRYTYTQDGLLHVRATLDKTNMVVLDQEITNFTHGNTLTLAEIQRQMTALEGVPRTASAPQPSQSAVGQSGSIFHSSPEASPTKTFIVDGSNIAWGGGDIRRGDLPSFARLLDAVDALKAEFPGATADVIVDAALAHQITHLESEALKDAMRSGLVTQVPAGTNGKADRMVATLASRKKAVVVTNDSFKELQAEFPWLLDGDRVLGATNPGGVWLFLPRTPIRSKRPDVNGR